MLLHVCLKCLDLVRPSLNLCLLFGEDGFALSLLIPLAFAVAWLPEAAETVAHGVCLRLDG